MTGTHALLLHTKIATVCPILGVSLGDLNDAKTWSINFDPSATKQQMDAATAALAAVTPAALASADALVTAAANTFPDPLAAAKAQAISALPTALPVLPEVPG